MMPDDFHMVLWNLLLIFYFFGPFVAFTEKIRYTHSQGITDLKAFACSIDIYRVMGLFVIWLKSDNSAYNILRVISQGKYIVCWKFA